MANNGRHKGLKIALVIFGALLVSSVILIIVLLNASPKTFRLSDEYYGKSEVMDISSEEYQRLIDEKKSFVVMVDKPDCYTTANMREWMANFPDDMQFKYYRIMIEDLKKTSLYEKVKFVPSVAIIHDGNVDRFLDANSDADASVYNSAENLKTWIKERIIF